MCSRYEDLIRESEAMAEIIVSLRFATHYPKTTHGGLGTKVAEAF